MKSAAAPALGTMRPNGRIVWDFLSSRSRDYDFSKNRRME
jgi:hypothetical protein